ncbi:hypothetical protein NL676_003430 [Syzygium grande]|nr:hypothetical protein NL676_003430 [Syzygium grande]
MRGAEGRDKLADAGGSSGDKDDFAGDVLAEGGAEGKEEEDGDGDGKETAVREHVDQIHSLSQRRRRMINIATETTSILFFGFGSGSAFAFL